MIERLRKNRIRTFTGKSFWPLEPRPQDVDIVDIAAGLSQRCRYNGHVGRTRLIITPTGRIPFRYPVHLSVAEHSVRVSRACSPKNKLAGLLHDCSEAYLPDIVRPVKLQIKDFYKPVEERLEAVVCEALKVEYPWAEEVHTVDHRMLTDEMMALLPYGDWLTDDGEWYYGEPLGIDTSDLGWPAEKAFQIFLEEYEALRCN